MDIDVLGIDLGKTVCRLAGLDATGAVMLWVLFQRSNHYSVDARLLVD